jgi:hypothetical protein
VSDRCTIHNSLYRSIVSSFFEKKNFGFLRVWVVSGGEA